MVVMSLQRHSRLSSSSFFLSNLMMQSCIMFSVNIFSLNSSPMKRMLPRYRRFAFASCRIQPKKKNYEKKKIVNKIRLQILIWFYPLMQIFHTMKQPSLFSSAHLHTPLVHGIHFSSLFVDFRCILAST